MSGHNWTPIGNDDYHRFKGTFDGDGHTISNLTINISSNNVGLFGYVEGGTVQNVTFENVNLSGDTSVSVGGIVGTNNGGTVTNCTVCGEVTGTGDLVSVGGLVGANSGTVSGNTVVATVSGYDDVGGLVGRNTGGTVSGNTVVATVSGHDDVGGLVGDNRGNVSNNTVVATVSCAWSYNAGGLVGENTSTVSNNNFCSNAGDVGKNKNGTVSNSKRYYKLTVPEGVTVSGNKYTVNGTDYYAGSVTLSGLKDGYVFSTGDSFTISSDTTVTRIPNSANHYVFANNSGGYTLATNSNVGNYPDLIQAYQLTVPSGVSVATNNDVISSGGKYYVKVGSSATLTIGKSAALVGVTGYSNVAANSSGTVPFKPTADVTINANNLYYAVSGLNNVTASGGTYTTVNGTNYYTANSSVTLSSNVNGAIIGAATATGGSVTVNDNGTATLTTTSAASTVTPTLYYSVSGLNNITASGGTYKTVNGTTYYKSGSSVTLTAGTGAIIGAATASGGSVTVNDNGTATLTTTSAASTVTPTLYYSVSGLNNVTASGGTYKTVNGTTYYKSGSSVTLTAGTGAIIGAATASGGSVTVNDNGTATLTTTSAASTVTPTLYYAVNVPNCVDTFNGTSITVSNTNYYQSGSTLTLTAKTGYVVDNVTVSSDTSITATVDTTNHYAFKDGDGYTYATDANVATNNYPDLTRVYAINLPDAVAVSGDKVATDDDGNTYAVESVTLSAAAGYTLQNVSVDGKELTDNFTFTVNADTKILADCIKFNNTNISKATAAEIGGTTGNLSTFNGVYSISASQHNSTLVGNDKNNTVVLTGGGENILTGGSGNDTYKFTTGGGIVTDYGIGATKSGDGSTLSPAPGSDIVKVDGKVTGVYFDRAASNKKEATFTAVVTYDSNGDSTADEVIVLKDIAKKPTKTGSKPVFQTNDVAAATLKIWDTSGGKQAVLSASKLKKLFHDDSELNDLGELIQAKVTYLGEIADGKTPETNPFEQTTTITSNGGNDG